MSEPGGIRRRFRATTERYLTIAAFEAMRSRYPDAGSRPPAYPQNAFWTKVFVPVYARIPWGVKQRVMRASGMTARGWTPPSREPGTPWRPPAPK